MLLDGPWGSGKTHFIKSFMKDNEDDTKFIYVSVYGRRALTFCTLTHVSPDILYADTLEP